MKQKEFGDFQTPPAFAARVCELLKEIGFAPRSIVEPTCGKGAFVQAALNVFDQASLVLGMDINREHLSELARETMSPKLKTRQADFYGTDWAVELRALEGPILILGNPPWVTSSMLASMQSGNVPEKENLKGHRGIDAMTGKSNFDICEWMIIELIKALPAAKGGAIAMLCKTTVARKVFTYCWKAKLNCRAFSIYNFDAADVFDISADACLFICEVGGSSTAKTCTVHEDLRGHNNATDIGITDTSELVADWTLYQRHKSLIGSSDFTWRSGVKHDCSDIMEFSKVDGVLYNGLREIANIEDTLLFPLLKSSDVANGRVSGTARRILLTQSKMSQDTDYIREAAPKTWRYLCQHKDRLARRGSSIYRTQPPFAIFGVGSYTFSPWKVAISGFYKRLQFQRIGPITGKPAVFDDTCYFVTCDSEKQAADMLALLQSMEAQQFYRAFIFWDGKRPITKEILAKLAIERLAEKQKLPIISLAAAPLFQEALKA